jgi:hypothetical protein
MNVGNRLARMSGRPEYARRQHLKGRQGQEKGWTMRPSLAFSAGPVSLAHIAVRPGPRAF